jgi:hypothetical protein
MLVLTQEPAFLCDLGVLCGISFSGLSGAGVRRELILGEHLKR